MATFAPTGNSIIVQLMGNLPQRVELPVTEGDIPALRIVSVAHPSSTAYTYIAMGDESVEASNQNSMAIDLSGRKEQIFGMINAPAYISIAMGGVTAGNYTLCITPGVLVA